ncbi:hypothetical protein ACFLY0_00215 [Patescibacteria group bacterium]
MEDFIKKVKGEIYDWFCESWIVLVIALVLAAVWPTLMLDVPD